MRYYRPSARVQASAYRSELEIRIVEELEKSGSSFAYEPCRIPYEVPARATTYTPDLVLPSGVVIEIKGEFVSSDRTKTKHVLKQHPDLHLRFVFASPGTRIGKKSTTTYGKWCDQQGISWAGRSIPEAWLLEKPDPHAIAALERATGKTFAEIMKKR